ncbi:DUF433 domain-containing protein [Gymnodinialimonas hymeniacidonis]|uniref:DUF433 domain-containing protein n=1 Tax=Gymnodinialimonas hymeniacidonis TaxID=3126508 RepID=UPI0034C5E517
MSVVGAFTDEMASRLTGLSVGQLRAWDRSGLISPSFADENRRLPFSRIYSFRDIVSLRVIAGLKNDHGVSTQHLKQVAFELRGLGEDAWSKTTLYVLNKRVVFEEPKSGRLQEVVGGQRVFRIPLKVATADVEADVQALFSRPKNLEGKTHAQRHVMNGEEVVAGTRIPVRSVLSYFELGLSDSRILEDYPDLVQADIDAIRAKTKGSAA